jgi:hypothetical protein
MGRQVYLLGVGLALVALAFVVTEALLGQRPGVTEANRRRIRPGMAVTEVEARLGARGGPTWDGAATLPGVVTPPSPPTGYIWCSDAGAFLVWVGEGGRVERTSWMPSKQARPGPLDRLRA